MCANTYLFGGWIHVFEGIIKQQPVTEVQQAESKEDTNNAQSLSCITSPTAAAADEDNCPAL